MKHEQLKNHIKGSFLKEQYLESFLVQSAYIEGILKIDADFNYWKAAGEKEMSKNPVLMAMYKKIDKYNLNALTGFLYESKIITKKTKGLLDSYRKKRNRVLHDLIFEISKETFEKDLKDVCTIGNKIIASREFVKIPSMIDFLEK